MAVEVEIRGATQADVPELVFLLKEFHDEMPMLPLSHERLVMTISQLLKEGMIFLAITTGRDGQGQIVGSIGLGPREWWFSDSVTLSDYWTYVRKGWRRTRAGHELLRAARDFADRASLPLVMGIFTFDQVDRKNKLFRRYLTPVGESFAHGLEYATGD